MSVCERESGGLGGGVSRARYADLREAQLTRAMVRELSDAGIRPVTPDRRRLNDRAHAEHEVALSPPQLSLASLTFSCQYLFVVQHEVGLSPPWLPLATLVASRYPGWSL